MKPQKPKTPNQKSYLFMRSLWKDYQDDPEARKFISRLSKKRKRNSKLQKILEK